MKNRQLTQDQLDRYDAFEATLDMMSDNDAAYTKAEITATIEQVIEQIKEDREEDAKPKVETYADRYPGARTQERSTQWLLGEADRLERKDELDTIDSIRYDFVKTELRMRAANGQI